MNKIEEFRGQKLNIEYTRQYWENADLSFLRYIKVMQAKHNKFNDVIITVDTETSKTTPNTFYTVKKKGKEIVKINPVRNIVVTWTLTISLYDKHLITLYGQKPSDLIKCITKIQNTMMGQKTFYWVHNLPYDYIFLRQFMFEAWGNPVKQLNVKPHYMLTVEFENGIIFRDSLILFQRKLEKIAKDLDVEHQKAVGFWDYDLLRTQKWILNNDELIYVENDTLALAECLIAYCKAFNNKIYELPYTATGIVRRATKNAALNHSWKKTFNKIVVSWELQQKLEKAFHGGYTHANRWLACRTQKGLWECYDFKSSYPFVLLTERYPLGAFKEIAIKDYKSILELQDDYAFVFKAGFVNPSLKKGKAMPILQKSKGVYCFNDVSDNGRILEAEYYSCYLNDVDFKLIVNQYDYDEIIIEDCYYCQKGYLPKWFRDLVFKFFKDKCELDGGDPVMYALAKAMLNSLFGMTCQHPVKADILEIHSKEEIEDLKEKGYDVDNIEVGDFVSDDKFNWEEAYEKWKKKKSSILPYQWGIYCTSYAMKNLFTLADMALKNQAKDWAYSDTDSLYCRNINKKAVEKYNKSCKEKLIKAGYGAVTIGEKEFWLGIAEHEELVDDYSEFKTLGAKRYCGRCKEDNKLHLTVSGVPKKAVDQLEDDIENFKETFVFKGEQSGKLTHFYQYEDMGIDDKGNEYADSVDLCPCDYELSNPYDEIFDFDEMEENLLYDDVEMIVYE